MFTKEIIRKYFPDEGDFEQKTMQKLAEDKHLRGLKYAGDWRARAFLHSLGMRAPILL